MDIDMADMGMGQYPVLSWAVGPPPLFAPALFQSPVERHCQMSQMYVEEN